MRGACGGPVYGRCGRLPVLLLIFSALSSRCPLQRKEAGQRSGRSAQMAVWLYRQKVRWFCVGGWLCRAKDEWFCARWVGRAGDTVFVQAEGEVALREEAAGQAW